MSRYVIEVMEARSGREYHSGIPDDNKLSSHIVGRAILRAGKDLTNPEGSTHLQIRIRPLSAVLYEMERGKAACKSQAEKDRISQTIERVVREVDRGDALQITPSGDKES